MNRIQVLGVPLDHGAGRRGVSMGPSALRIARLQTVLERIGYEVRDRGDIPISIPETMTVGNPRAKYLALVADVCQEVSEEVRGILKEDDFPLIIGGDHSISIGTISGIHAFLKDKSAEWTPRKLGVLWFDAHADINTPKTSPSGNIHGMPVSCLLNRGPRELTSIGFPGPKVDPRRFVEVGLRTLDDRERSLLTESGVHAFTMADIDRRGIASVVEEALKLTVDGTEFLHVSFDIDVLDPQVAPGTGTPTIGGLTYREAHLALEMVASTGRLRSLELVEVNPTLDQGNLTAELAVGLIASALGKRIL